MSPLDAKARALAWAVDQILGDRRPPARAPDHAHVYADTAPAPGDVCAACQLEAGTGSMVCVDCLRLVCATCATQGAFHMERR